MILWGLVLHFPESILRCHMADMFGWAGVECVALRRAAAQLGERITSTNQEIPGHNIGYLSRPLERAAGREAHCASTHAVLPECPNLRGLGGAREQPMVHEHACAG
jgi:hypothetical protein